MRVSLILPILVSKFGFIHFAKYAFMAIHRRLLARILMNKQGLSRWQTQRLTVRYRHTAGRPADGRQAPTRSAPEPGCSFGEDPLQGPGLAMCIMCSTKTYHLER